MKISIQIVVEPENDEPVITKTIAEFKRKDLACDTVGLTIEESKILLENVQTEFARHQVKQHIYSHRICNQCQRKLKVKGYTKLVYRTLFGKLKLANPRLYICSCNKDNTKKSINILSAILPERTSPELQYLQTKWSSLVSYGTTSKILEEVLPVHTNISSIYYIMVPKNWTGKKKKGDII